MTQPVASVTELRGAGRHPTLLAKDAAESRATAKASPLTGCRGYSWGPSMVLEFESPLVSEGAAGRVGWALSSRGLHGPPCAHPSRGRMTP